MTLQNDVFDALSNNLSGGALLLQSGTLNVIDTEIRDTHAFRGGGLFVAGGTANVDRTLWLNNDGTTGGGGAIYNNAGTLTVTNSTFAANTANSAHGGAIYAAASTALRNVTFEANSASGNGGGGSALWVAAAASTANVLFGTSAYQENCGGSPPTELGGSIDTGTSCGLAAGASGRTVLLGPLALGSLLPWAGSAGIDAGDNAQCATVDQRGTVRPRTLENPCDAGAVEGSAGSPPPPPLIAGGAQRDTTTTSVLLDATIDRRGIPTAYVVEYGLTSAYGSTSRFGGAVAFGSGAGPQDVTDFLDELLPGTTYHYRFVATSAGGTATGEDRTFRTVGAPLVATREATAITETRATLHGSINPSGDESTYWFEYGPTTAYGSKTPVTSAGAEFTEQAVSAIVSGLDPGTTQHFRLVAVNEASGDPVAGGDRTFTTATPPPVATVSPEPTSAAQPTPAATPLAGVVVKPVSGTVLVRRPGSRQFVELDATEGLPDGSTIDAKRGVVELTSGNQTAQFRDGIFRINRRGSIVELTLTEQLAPCKRSGARASAKKPKSRKLWGKGSGRFRTVGQYSAATIRGTRWLVQDSCAGTLTRVTEGVVTVRDKARGRTIIVRAGKRYLARPRRSV